MSQTHTARIYTDQDKLLPRVLVYGMVALALSTLAIAAFASFTDRPLESTPPISKVQAEADVRLVSDGMSGAVQVFDQDNALVIALTPEEGGFIAGVHRVVLRERTKNRVPLDGPVTIKSMENGRLSVFDPSTGWGADLMGFGQTNAATFARLLALFEKGNTNGISNERN